MRQLLPDPPGDVAPYDAYRPADPWANLVRVNMVSSVDGRVTDEHGGSAGLGGPGDLEVFRALRALADGILTGAGTVRSEGYGPHRLHASVAGRRREDGRPEPAAMIVLSGSLDLDPDSAIFTEARTPTIVLTCESAPPERRARLRRVATVIDAGEQTVNLKAGIERLRGECGLAHLLVEGGPRVNRALFAAALVDELCLTLASQLAGTGEGPGIIGGSLPAGVALSLGTVLTDGRDLFARYAVER